MNQVCHILQATKCLSNKELKRISDALLKI